MEVYTVNHALREGRMRAAKDNDGRSGTADMYKLRNNFGESKTNIE